MRKASIARLMAVASTFLSLVGPATAARDDKAFPFAGTREIRLLDGALFNGKLLDEGLYRMSWGMNRDRERVEVRLYQGKRMIGTVTGRLVDRDSPASYDSIVFTRGRIGERELAEIRFAGSESVISLIEGAGTVAGNR